MTRQERIEELKGSRIHREPEKEGTGNKSLWGRLCISLLLFGLCAAWNLCVQYRGWNPAALESVRTVLEDNRVLNGMEQAAAAFARQQMKNLQIP